MKCLFCNGRLKVVEGPYSPLLVCVKGTKAKPHPFMPVDKETGEIGKPIWKPAKKN